MRSDLDQRELIRRRSVHGGLQNTIDKLGAPKKNFSPSFLKLFRGTQLEDPAGCRARAHESSSCVGASRARAGADAASAVIRENTDRRVCSTRHVRRRRAFVRHAPTCAWAHEDASVARRDCARLVQIREPTRSATHEPARSKALVWGGCTLLNDARAPVFYHRVVLLESEKHVQFRARESALQPPMTTSTYDPTFYYLRQRSRQPSAVLIIYKY